MLAGVGAGEGLEADGVFSGGGIKGLAFAGALAGAEQAGYRRWHELAGTSAGAITAMTLAVGYDAKRLKDTLYADEHGEPLDPDGFPVWKAVRISASYPYFFPPLKGLWDKATGKQGVFVDGGVVSAFPLFVFDKPQPRHPTWGFHLHGGFDANEDAPSYREIGGPTWPKEMLEA